MHKFIFSDFHDGSKEEDKLISQCEADRLVDRIEALDKDISGFVFFIIVIGIKISKDDLHH